MSSNRSNSAKSELGSGFRIRVSRPVHAVVNYMKYVVLDLYSNEFWRSEYSTETHLDLLQAKDEWLGTGEDE